MNAVELIDYSVQRFRTIEEYTQRLTTGNVSHLGATIACYARNTAEYIEIEKASEEFMPTPLDSDITAKTIDWLRDIADLASRLTSGNVAHMGCTIRGKAIRCYEYIQKHRV